MMNVAAQRVRRHLARTNCWASAVLTTHIGSFPEIRGYDEI
jgi:hypothetical protein